MIGLPYAANGWDQIIPNLWMGGHDRAGGPGELPVERVVVANEFDLVVSLYARPGYGPAAGVEHLYRRIPDGPLLPAEWRTVCVLADTVATAVQAGRRTMVRCQAGYNRSGLVVAKTLMNLGHTADSAIALVRERRSRHALFNEYFRAYLHEPQEVAT